MGACRITLLRHGDAESADAWAEDFERPLTRRGRAEAAEMGKRLKYRNMAPDLILASPAERAWTTAQLVLRECELDDKQLQCARELYLASAETIWQLISRQSASAQHILVCAHNPGLSALASRFGPKQQPRDLPTAGMASGLWSGSGWQSLSPRSAKCCELDDPESLADLWS